MGLKPVTSPDTEAATIELTLDGELVTAKEGVSLYDVISSTGKIVPAMCYHYTFDPFGSCGMCLVMQEGKKAPVRSCTAKATAGMMIRTDGEDLFLARKKGVENCAEHAFPASQYRSVFLPTNDPEAGYQQSKPGLCQAGCRRVFRQWRRRAG